MLNKLQRKIFNYLYKKMDQEWDTYYLGDNIDGCKELHYHDFGIIDDVNWNLDVCSITHIHHKNIYAVEMNFYHGHHDENGSHGDYHFIEYISDLGIDKDPDKITIEALNRWVDKFDYLMEAREASL